MLKLVERASPLAHVVRQGRFGADRGAPGVALSIRHPASIVTIIARKDKADAASKAVATRFGAGLPAAGKSSAGEGVSFHWCGADQWYAIADGFSEGALYGGSRKRSAALPPFGAEPWAGDPADRRAQGARRARQGNAGRSPSKRVCGRRFQR